MARRSLQSLRASGEPRYQRPALHLRRQILRQKNIPPFVKTATSAALAVPRPRGSPPAYTTQGCRALRPAQRRRVTGHTPAPPGSRALPGRGSRATGDPFPPARHRDSAACKSPPTRRPELRGSARLSSAPARRLAHVTPKPPPAPNRSRTGCLCRLPFVVVQSSARAPLWVSSPGPAEARARRTSPLRSKSWAHADGALVEDLVTRPDTRRHPPRTPTPHQGRRGGHPGDPGAHVPVGPLPVPRRHGSHATFQFFLRGKKHYV